MTIEELENALLGWVENEVSVPAIFAYQPQAVRPETLYVSINIINISQIGHEETASTLLIDNSIDVENSTLKQLTASINTFYAGAFQVAHQLRNSLSKLTTIELLYTSGLGFNDTTDVRKIPAILENEWEERAQFDITFYFRQSVQENIETIRQVELTNEIDNSSFTVP